MFVSLLDEKSYCRQFFANEYKITAKVVLSNLIPTRVLVKSIAKTYEDARRKIELKVDFSKSCYRKVQNRLQNATFNSSWPESCYRKGWPPVLVSHFYVV